MTYSELIQKFLEKVQVIKKLNPSYKQPGNGSGGICDCIGLIIGAIERMGLKWKGIHGSNYWARYNTVDLAYIAKESDLSLGDVVYKACGKDNRTELACHKGYKTHKWDLPDRYWNGHQYYNGDMHDYYHAGVVTQVNPLNITHMTSPHMKVDTNLNGGWNYHGKAKPIVKAASSGSVPSGGSNELPMNTPVATSGAQAVVVADSGGTVNMRAGSGTNYKILARVPLGTTVEIITPGEKWAKIKYGNKTGWMMARFLDIIGDGKGKY